MFLWCYLLQENITTDDAVALTKDSSALVLISIGDPFVPVDPRILLVCEKAVLLDLVEFTEAAEMLFALYYILNMQYPRGSEATYVFVQKHILGIQDSYKVPPKLVSFVGKLC